MKLIQHNDKLYFQFDTPFGILLLPANGKDIDQIEKAIKNVREGRKVDA